MVIWSTLEASCPMCSNRVRLREVGSGFASGQDSDLFVRMDGKHVIQAEVHTCNKCHFSGYVKDFTASIPAAACRRFLDEVSPALVDDFATGGVKPPAYGRTPLPDVQYYWAYLSAQALNLKATQQGQRLVRAYWCLRLSPTTKLPRDRLKALRKIYLKGAIQKLRQGLRYEKDRNQVYWIAELCRRNGNFLLAINYFRRFLEKEPGARYLKQAARKLLEEARQGSAEELSMEEVLYDRAPDANPLGGADAGGGA